MKPIELINEAREFTAADLFFSTTDLKGRIQRANSVFQRIAAYSWDELHNKPHNIIRHPDMPRVVFQILWDYVQEGRPVVALVKNLAHDGRYYWVMALVTPFPGGYLSVRFKPSSPLFATVKHLYAELRAIEADIEKGANDRKAAIAASRKALDNSLLSLGFSDYGAFMGQLLKLEMQSREAHLRPGMAPSSTGISFAGHTTPSGSLRGDAENLDKLVGVLNTLFSDLESYVEISREVRAKSGSVSDISESLRVSALNGVMAVDGLGARAAGLRPVLDWLRALSLDISQTGIRLSASLDELVKDVDLVVFGLSAAKLQIEMTARLAHELIDRDVLGGDGTDTRHSEIGRMTEGAMEILHASSCETVRHALSGLEAIKGRLTTLTESQTRLLDTSRSLRPIYLTGRIEMADVGGTKLASVFHDVGDQLEETGINLGGLRDVLHQLDAHLDRGLAHGVRVEQTIMQIDSHVNIP